MKISVACCTYNGRQYIRQQLDSIIHQSAPVQEIIICDDQSTDGTDQTVTEIAAGSPIPIHLHQNPTRLGVTKNFEQAISLTTGDIIFLSDQDDVWKSEKVEQCILSFSDPAVGMVFSNGQVVREDLSPAGYSLWDSVWFDAAEQLRMRTGEQLPVLLRHAVAAGATLAFRAAFCPLILPIPDLPHCHDIWISLLLACVSRIYPLNENLIDYRLHANNEVGLRRHGLISQLRMARWQLRFGAFQYAADLHREARNRLENHASNLNMQILNPQAVRKLLNEKINHSIMRQNLPPIGPSRFKAILRELKAGGYARYSYGYKSVLQDLFLR